MMYAAIVILGLLQILAGCRTSEVAEVKEVNNDPPRRELYCSFASPFDPGDQFDAWVDPEPTGALESLRYVHIRQGNELAQGTLRGLPGADKLAVTDQGRRRLRSASKTIVDVNFEKFNCFNLEPRTDRASFLCLGKDRGRFKKSSMRPAFWATNLGARRYGNELTIYESNCRLTEI
jgi:hypothetical protein